MVEAGANEIPEAEILDALDIAHDEIKKLCARSASWPRRPARRRSRSRRRRSTRRCSSRSSTSHGARSTRRRRSRTSSSARTRPRPSRRRSLEQYAGDPDADDHAERRAAAARASTSSRRRRSASASPSRRSAPTAARQTRSARSRSRSASLPRTHGSALFTRGQTQALSVVALGTLKEEMRLDTLGLETEPLLLAPLQLPALLGRGGRLHARARSAATSATARSPSARSCR